MGYCYEAGWLSDYYFKKVIDWREEKCRNRRKTLFGRTGHQPNDDGDRRDHRRRAHISRCWSRSQTPSANNRVVASHMITHQPENVESSTDGYPDSPSATFPLMEADAHALVEIEPLFIEQLDSNSIVFFDDEKCDLNPTFSAVHSGNHERAMELSLENAESCRDVAAAHYNVGVLYRIMGDFDAAMEKPAKGKRGGSGQHRHPLRDDGDALGPERRRQPCAQATERHRGGQDAARAGEVVMNEDVLRMVEEGLPDVIIIQVIEMSDDQFDVTPATLVQLNRRGVSQAVISAMIAAGRGQR